MSLSPLARTLSALRKAKGASLRDVEKATGVSNAYVSQLERGDAAKPSVDKLYSLSKYYGVPYQDLLESAGYIEASDKERPVSSALQNALMAYDLSPDEEDLVMKFVQTIKGK